MNTEEIHPFFSQAKNHPEVIAHRGGNGQWPGETMAAYKGAIGLGVDVIEMDVYLTNDGQLVLMHDKNVATTTEGQGAVNDFTLDDIQRLNAGYRWSADGENFPYQAPLNQLPADLQNDLRVPSLKEVFEAFPAMRMIVEMKPADASPAAALCQILREHQMTEKVLIASFSSHYMNEFRALCPDVATSVALSVDDVAEVLIGVHWFDDQPVKPSVLEAPHYLISHHLIKKVRAHGLRLHAWTVNELDDMKRMIDLGVDGIITDYPGRLMALLGRT
jgi:glycerophosphoryl diester phosphodiesterase